MQREDLFLKQLNNFVQFIGYLIDSKSNNFNKLEKSIDTKEFEFLNDFLTETDDFQLFKTHLSAFPAEYLYELLNKLLHSNDLSIPNQKEKLTLINEIYIQKSGNYNINFIQKINQL